MEVAESRKFFFDKDVSDVQHYSFSDIYLTAMLLVFIINLS